jgi:hypothetical protein
VGKEYFGAEWANVESMFGWPGHSFTTVGAAVGFFVGLFVGNRVGFLVGEASVRKTK